MWSNVISIDKQYGKEINYVLDKLKELNNVSYATEEAKDRIYIYLASVCEVGDEVEERIFEILETVYLTFFKLRFFLSNLHNPKLTLPNCALICSLVHFDREYERNIVLKALSESMDYNVDGIMNFRLHALTENWEELCSVASRLTEAGGDSCDMYDVATFITGSEGGDNRISADGRELYNLTKRRRVEIVGLFDSEEFNVLSAIIGERPGEVIIENGALSENVTNALRHIARVVIK